MTELRTTLYTYAASPYGAKVYWFLKYKKLPFDLVYVSGLTQKQIEFTGQRMIPVLKVGDEWRLESTDHGLWLDELAPDRKISSHDENERARILELDAWVTAYMIDSMFRRAIGIDDYLTAMRDGGRISRLTQKTSGGSPAWITPIRPRLMRRADFIMRAADRLDRFKTIPDLDRAILDGLEEHLADGPFLGGFDAPTLADLSAYAQINLVSSLGLKGYPAYFSRPAIKAWIAAVEDLIEDQGAPELLPGYAQRIAVT